MKIAIFDAKNYDQEWFDKVNEGRHDITYFHENLSLETIDLATGFDAISAFVNTDGSSEIIENLAKLNVKVWLQRSMGYNLVNLERAKELGIRVFRVTNYSAESVGEHALALLMSLNRRINSAALKTKKCNFSLENLQGKVVHDSTVGVVGAGKIGQTFIKIMKGMGANVLVSDSYAEANFNKTAEKLGFEWSSIEKLAQKSDFISLHAPLLPSTKHIINADLIKIMKPGVVIINTSRGPLVSTTDLIDGIKKGIVGGAGLDVLEREAGRFFFNREVDEEKIKKEDPEWDFLLSSDKVIITAHQAFFTTTALAEIARVTLDNASLAETTKSGPTELIWEAGKVING